MTDKLTNHERVVIALNSINWIAMRQANLLSNFQAINHVNSSDVTERLEEEYNGQLALAAQILDDLAQDMAEFMNGNDSTNKDDEDSQWCI